MDGAPCARGSCPLEDDARSFHFPLPPVTRLHSVLWVVLILSVKVVPRTRLHETASWTRISAQRRDPEIRARGDEFSKSFLTSHGVTRLLFKSGSCVGARWGSRGNCSFCREVDKVLENAPLGNGVLLCALLSFLVLLVRFPTGLVLPLYCFPDVYSDRGPITVTFRCLSFASFCRFLLAYCLFVWLRRLWVHTVFKYMASSP